MNFGPSKLSLKIQESIGTFNSQSGNSFGSVWAHSLTFSHTLKNVNMSHGLHF
jgi:hypothetical protein